MYLSDRMLTKYSQGPLSLASHEKIKKKIEPYYNLGEYVPQNIVYSKA